MNVMLNELGVKECIGCPTASTYYSVYTLVPSLFSTSTTFTTVITSSTTTMKIVINLERDGTTTSILLCR